jgi:cytochrome c oxidase subunit 2
MYEWVYVAAVVAILIWVGASSWDVERIIEEVPANAETIKVIGQQWFWSFEHADGTKEINELHVEQGKPYRFEITSIDVNHNFNVPDFVILMDAVPGRINTLWNMFDQTGEFLIQCREYCGFSHYNMKAKLFVEPPVTPVAAESPPTSTPITTPNATVVPKQEEEESAIQVQPSGNATSAASAGGENATTQASANATSSGAAPAAAEGITLTILEGSSIQGNPDYDPKELTVKKGDKILVDNVDTMPHSVTNGESGSDPNSGKLFDTSIINGGDSAELDTSTIDAGAHPYYCIVHPYMTGTLTVE